MTKFAIFLATFLLFALRSSVNAQELPKALVSYDKSGKLLTINQPGVYGVSTTKPLNTLLIPINPQERWNVVYQQGEHTTLLSSIQFHSELHVFVTNPEQGIFGGTEISVPVTVSSDSARISTQSAQVGSVKGAATNRLENQSVHAPVITINKGAATIAATPNPVTKPVIPKITPMEPSVLDALFVKYGQEYGVSSEVLKRIAQCESGLRPEALSKNGLYGGLFQFVSSTWSSNRRAMGLDPDPALRFNAEEAIKTAAFKISQGGIGAWPHCGKKATVTSSVASI